MNKLTAEEGLHKYIHNGFREKKQKQEEKKKISTRPRFFSFSFFLLFVCLIDFIFLQTKINHTLKKLTMNADWVCLEIWI